MESMEVKNLIIKSFNEKKNSHAFLFETNNVDKCYSDILDLIRIINCKNNGEKECSCNVCNTIKAQTNPDVLIIEPEGKEIKSDQIINITRIFSTKPLINPYSCYLIKNADKMNVSAANKLLKFLEEPEDNIFGFFITDKLQTILPTIKSRCEIYNYRFGSNNILDVLEISEEEYGSYFDYAFDLVDKLNGSPKYLLMTESKNFAKKERIEIEIILKLIKKIYTIKYENLLFKKYENIDYVSRILSQITTNDLKVVVKRIKLLDNILNDFEINVNKELIINKLFLSWE